MRWFSKSLHAAPPPMKGIEKLQNWWLTTKQDVPKISLVFFISWNPHNTAKQSVNPHVNIRIVCVFALCFLPLLSGVFNGKFKDQFILDG